MDQELQALDERVTRIVSLARRLAEENVSLRDQLKAATSANQQMQQRIGEAKSRVEAALSRLPGAQPGSQAGDAALNAAASAAAAPSASAAPTAPAS